MRPLARFVLAAGFVAAAMPPVAPAPAGEAASPPPAAALAAPTNPAPPWTPAVLDELRRLQREALQDEYAYQRLAHLTDHIGPRPSGSVSK